MHREVPTLALFNLIRSMECTGSPALSCLCIFSKYRVTPVDHLHVTMESSSAMELNALPDRLARTAILWTINDRAQEHPSKRHQKVYR